MDFKNEFGCGETLLRGIHKKPDFWDEEENRPSSAAFMDKKGVSVNRTGETKKCYEKSLECLKNNLGERLRAVAELEVDFCVELGVYLKYCPEKDNIYHSEIHRSKSEILLTKSVARKLSKACKIVD